MQKSHLHPVFRRILFITLFVVSYTFCVGQPGPGKDTISNEAPYHGYNILLPKKYPVSRLISEINSGLNTRITLTEHVRVCPCDTLINLDYPNLELEINGHDKVVVRVKDGQGGDLELSIPNVMINKNYEFYLGENFADTVKTTPSSYFAELMLSSPQLSRTKQAKRVTLAILDTGLDTTVLKLKYVGVDKPNSTCVFPAAYINKMRNYKQGSSIVKGLNFAPKNELAVTNRVNDVADNHGHGTKVAYLAVEQFNQQKDKAVRLLIMKVLNKQNKGDAFGVICAMFHSKMLGADIINMSLGYYGPEDVILKRYVNSMKVRRSYTDKHFTPIWITAASGNAMQVHDNDVDKSDKSEDRDLSRRVSKFYPAYFSKEINNVISVTTADDGLEKTCALQNYDPTSVDISVKGQMCFLKVNDYHGRNGRVPAEGTSYAAPVVAGWIGIKPNLTIRKDLLLNEAIVVDKLKNYVRKGRYITPYWSTP